MLKQVTKVWIKTAFGLLMVNIENDAGETTQLKTTDEHPFFVEGAGWVQAADLKPGDRLLQPDGAFATVTATLSEQHESGLTVYNLEVEGAHTYFVNDATSGAMVWVHNANGYDGWFKVNESMPSAARQFQRQAAGTVNRAYYKNGVKFDGHRKGVLLEAKGLGYSKLLQPGSSTFFPVAKNLMAQAQRQVKAASGQKIQWIVAERDVADKLEQAFRIKRWPIEVIHRKILW